jgi:hypothetical protein
MNYITSTTSIQAEPVLMRRATSADSARIWELARLDNRRMPAGPHLVAEVSGEIVAAFSLSTSAVVADPFRPTSDAVAMLKLRANQVSDIGELAERRARRNAERSPETAVAA